MILQSLNALYDRLGRDKAYLIPPRDYSLQRISFKVVLHSDGRLCDIQDARVNRDGRLVSRQQCVPGRAKSSGSGLNPTFLWDTAQYMLGFKAEDPKPGRTQAAFESFRSLHCEREQEIGSGAFSAVCRFLEVWRPADATACAILDELSGGYGVFQIIGNECFVHEDPDVARWWSAHPGSGEGESEAQCLVTGAMSLIANTHPPIKGLESTGSVIVGFNKPAYESYGKSQSHNAPVGVEAAFRYTTALNALLDGPMKTKHKLSFGDDVVVFWTKEASWTEDVFARFAEFGSDLLQRPEAQDEAVRSRVEAYLRVLRQGRQARQDWSDDLEGAGYCLLGLAPNRARLAIRFFLTGSLGNLLENQRRHFRDIAIEPEWAEGAKHPDPEFPSIVQLLDQTCPTKENRPDRQKLPAILVGPLFRSIVSGLPYPGAMYAAVLRRIHADREVRYLRACVIKGFLNRNRGKEVTMSLDAERRDPGYLIGRLFAALEKTQTDALGRDVNATIRDRFYSAASATPRAVLPRLLRTYQHHLAKLEGGHRVNREKLLQEIVSALKEFPAHLDLDGQGLFAIGYYHQMRAFFTGKSAPDAADSAE